MVRLRFAPRVTRKHGAIFAERWRKLSDDAAAITEAVAHTELVEWPDSDSWEETEAQNRYFRIEDEIAERTFDAVRDAIEKAFVTIASEVLARERALRRKTGRR